MSKGALVYLALAAGVPLVVVLIGSAINYFVYRRPPWRW
jgi:hypothetical protein